MASKELGLIHTTNHTINLLGLEEQNTPFVASNLDVAGELTSQLQRTVRCGNYFKTVGIDISLGVNQDLEQSVAVSGELRYYAPTQGRCEAFRSAFKAMADQMKMQGISMRDNPLYDFRAPLNVTAPADAGVFANQATLDGVDGLSLNNASDGLGIFNVHNDGVKPIYEGTAEETFSAGFKTLLDRTTSRTDFVLNDSALFTGNEHIADLEYETIPFQLAYSTTNDEQATATFQWRPDPALFLAVMCGQFQLVVNDMDVDSVLAAEVIEINISIMTSGWKSIMGKPEKKNARRMK